MSSQRGVSARASGWTAGAFVAVLIAVLAATGVWSSGDDGDGAAGVAAGASETESSSPVESVGGSPAAGTTGSSATSTMPATTTVPPPLPPYDGWVNPASAGRPWSDTVTGMLTFRGNPTRSWYGVGPIPRAEPEILWRFPTEGGLCHESSSRGETKVWCGTGWTGQPNIWERPDGSTWLAFGSYAAAYHFLDPATGHRLLPDLETGDINKGSATVDPDGFPLYYAGSRDNQLRIIALDRSEPEVLWSLAHDAYGPTMWNSDWDGASIVLDDYLFVGGENSRFFVIKLNRAYGDDGLVTVSPEVVFHAAGWDDELLGDIGDKEVSIESSVTISGNVVYFANSGGLVQGWDVSGLKSGQQPQRVFRYWMGDDVDATIAADAEGFLYVGAEVQRHTSRTDEVGGTFVKLDPRNPDNPLVWTWAGGTDEGAGIWSSAAIVGEVVITSTNDGRVVGLDRATGAEVWRLQIGAQAWPSPVVVDGVMLVGDCDGYLYAYDVADPLATPGLLWSKKFDGCLEATPTVWKGRIYLGSRDGGFYALG